MLRRLLILWLALWAPAPESFQFAILGDRTGEAEAGVYEKALQAATAGNPAFVLSVGDTIQGLRDETAAAEWQQWERLTQPFRKYAFYLAPGNHDVWSDGSARLFAEHAGKPLHYSFDYGSLHITVLNNSRSEQLSPGELSFLEEDLKAHAEARVKLIVSHRPSWVINVLMRDTDFPLHRLARKYGVKYVVAGHVHEMLHYTLEGVEYVSMVSSGGHLRASRRYEDGWFFGYASVAVAGDSVTFRIHGLDGRNTLLGDWGPSGLLPGK